MKKVKPHFFFDTEKLSLDDKKQILIEGFDLQYHYQIDKLNPKKSFARVTSKMTFPEIMKMFNSKSHFVMIYRKGLNDPYYLEIGFSTTKKDITYFLFLNLNEEHIKFFKNKYNLKELENGK